MGRRKVTNPIRRFAIRLGRRLGLTYRELADKFDVSVGTIQNVLRSKE